MRIAEFSRDGDCALHGGPCGSVDTNCRRCVAPLLFPEEARRIVRGEDL